MNIEKLNKRTRKRQNLQADRKSEAYSRGRGRGRSSTREHNMVGDDGCYGSGKTTETTPDGRNQLI